QAKQAIARIQNNEAIEVIIYVPERDVAIGQASDVMFAKATFDAFPGKTFDLQLKEFETQADPVTQTFKVKFILPRPKDIQVLPGMSANVTVGVRPKEGQAPPSSFLIPSAAVSAGPEGKAFAWVVEKDETVHQREIQLGAVSGTESIEVQGGLEPGERIVTAGVFHLREGMKVRPKAADEKLVE
ncbi:MAG TPA: efflux RND transporter periplasmic adaptor subunit, partial [bacterium]|nr:efflux RND transporter periplasmic adaptor subunit [bacterium]